MIDETRTLKAMLRDVLQLKNAVSRAHNISGLEEMSAVSAALSLILDQYRDRPIRCEGGGSTVIRSLEQYGDLSMAPIVFSKQQSQEERDAEQEATWRKLFEL